MPRPRQWHASRRGVGLGRPRVPRARTRSTRRRARPPRRPWPTRWTAGEVGEPGILWWAADHIEALWRLGDVGAARRRHDELRAQAERTERRWARAVAARCGGLLAPRLTRPRQAFAEAMVWHRALDIPFERARTLLCLGERRRAAGHGDAEGPLREALGTFESLGAQPWASQALALLGERRTAPLPVDADQAGAAGRGLVGRAPRTAKPPTSSTSARGPSTSTSATSTRSSASAPAPSSPACSPARPAAPSEADGSSADLSAPPSSVRPTPACVGLTRGPRAEHRRIGPAPGRLSRGGRARRRAGGRSAASERDAWSG